MNQVYTQEQLQVKKLSELKELAAKFKIEPTGDNRLKETWVTAILASQPQKVAKFEFESPQNILKYAGLSFVSCGNGDYLINNSRDLVTLKVSYADEEGYKYQVQILPNYASLWEGESLEGAFGYCVQFFGCKKADNKITLVFCCQSASRLFSRLIIPNFVD